MKCFDKRCPECRADMGFWKFMRVTSRKFQCPACGARLLTFHYGRAAIGVILASPFMALPMSLAYEDHRWWWALIPGVAIYALILSLFMSPKSARSS